MKKINRTNLNRLVSTVCVVVVALGMSSLWNNAAATNSKEAADLVRWDIISILPVPPANGSVVTAGGNASAFAYSTPGNPSNAMIKLTGFGTFVAPPSGGTSSSVTGGGTWETSGAGLPAASGNYRVTKLVSWEFANFTAVAPAFIDEIANRDTRVNGTAVLLIEFDDGSKGILGIGCHGPGAPNGILEGVIATKDYVTYWDGQLPAPAVDANRTIFHILR